MSHLKNYFLFYSSKRLHFCLLAKNMSKNIVKTISKGLSRK